MPPSANNPSIGSFQILQTNGTSKNLWKNPSVANLLHPTSPYLNYREILHELTIQKYLLEKLKRESKQVSGSEYFFESGF
jgi:hypothetical protein